MRHFAIRLKHGAHNTPIFNPVRDKINEQIRELQRKAAEEFRANKKETEIYNILIEDIDSLEMELKRVS